MGYILDLRSIEGVGHRPLQMVACDVLLFNEKGQVLIEKRADDGTWCFPGGSMELGESTEEAAKREFLEETGLVLGNIELYDVVAGESTHFIYPNGDEIYAIDIYFIGYEYAGELKEQVEEVLELKWCAVQDLPDTLNINDRYVIEKYLKLQSEKES